MCSSMIDMIQFINNVNIILIENHMYSECYETFHDVIDFMKTTLTTIHSGGQNDNDDNNDNKSILRKNRINISNILDNATQKLCVCIQQNNQSYSNNNSHNVSNEQQHYSDVIILDIDNDDSFDHSMKLFTTTTRNGNHNNQDILLRINHHYESSSLPSSHMPSRYHDEDQYCHNNNNNIDINYAILLYNYSIACKRCEALIQKQNQIYDHNGIRIVKQQNDDDDEFVDELQDLTSSVHSGSQLLMNALKSFESSYRHMIRPLSIVSYNMNHNEQYKYYYQTDDESSSLLNHSSNMLRIVMISTLITMNICTLSYDMCLLDIGNIYYYNKYQPLIQLFHVLYNEYKKKKNNNNASTNAAAAAAA